MNLGLGGNWDGTLPNIHKAQQRLTLISGGCRPGFSPQENALTNIRQVVLTMLGKSGLGPYGQEGSIYLRKRVFTKVDMSADSDEAGNRSVVEPAEDPTGLLRRHDANWRILEKGDFVDVLATLTVPLTRNGVGSSGDLMVEPRRILRLRSSFQIAPILRLPATFSPEPNVVMKRRIASLNPDELVIGAENTTDGEPAKKKKRRANKGGPPEMDIDGTGA
ncbi:hypothetical protein LXA43DRAFT_1104729 [Ganoderma leucocontextum]|nr:hypothetical protein LXA43DRAFT_1104729 [Ganoderma leucocontextum]